MVSVNFFWILVGEKFVFFVMKKWRFLIGGLDDLVRGFDFGISFLFVEEKKYFFLIRGGMCLVLYILCNFYYIFLGNFVILYVLNFN